MNRTVVIVSMPRKRLAMARCASPWLRESGNSSSKLMKTIIPATKANAKLSTNGVMNGDNTKKPMIAPIGSDIPERRDQRNAFFGFLLRNRLGSTLRFLQVCYGVQWRLVAQDQDEGP